MEVVFTENLAGAEVSILAVALESNEPPPYITTSVGFERSAPSLRLVLQSPELDRDRLHRLGQRQHSQSRAHMGQAMGFIVQQPDVERWQRQDFTAEKAQSRHRAPVKRPYRLTWDDLQEEEYLLPTILFVPALQCRRMGGCEPVDEPPWSSRSTGVLTVSNNSGSTVMTPG